MAGETAAPLVIWMADCRDRREHGVTIDQAEATAQACTGIYESLCEVKFRPASMMASPGPRCGECERRHQRLIGTWRPANKPIFWRFKSPKSR